MDIKTIQKQLKKANLAGQIFTLGNMFINEDILPEENCIQTLTGFTGSAAILFVSLKKAFLFVDGRYELQAKKEVNQSQIEIVKLTAISFNAWLEKNFKSTPARISYNPWTLSINTLNALKKLLPLAEFIAAGSPDKYLSPRQVKTFAHQKKFTKLSAKEKIAELTKILKKNNLDAYLLTSAASVSWLLNLRSDALPYTPVLRAYALIDKTGAYKIFAAHTNLKEALPFENLASELQKTKNIAADFCTAPAIIQSFAPNITNLTDPVSSLKGTKNDTELKGFKNAHVRDGAALSKFLFWLEKNYPGKTESAIAEKLLEFRKKEQYFYSESFAPIAGFGKNSAVVHYHATANSAAKLKKGSLLLLDTGAQYLDGTTDVTRTIALGAPSPDMIEKNTLVLKAHIALASAVFLPETSGNELDLIARQPLLKKGLNFNHGTGHGVGFFSNVHEGPARISISAKQSAPLTPGTVTSIEPGYYQENAFGIRIENLYYAKQIPNTNLLKFEILTLAPIDKRLIDKYLLAKEELDWLNAYHKRVLDTLKKYMSKQELNWLKNACAPL